MQTLALLLPLTSHMALLDHLISLDFNFLTYKIRMLAFIKISFSSKNL